MKVNTVTPCPPQKYAAILKSARLDWATVDWKGKCREGKEEEYT